MDSPGTGPASPAGRHLQRATRNRPTYGSSTMPTVRTPPASPCRGQCGWRTTQPPPGIPAPCAQLGCRRLQPNSGTLGTSEQLQQQAYSARRTERHLRQIHSPRHVRHPALGQPFRLRAARRRAQRRTAFAQPVDQAAGAQPRADIDRQAGSECGKHPRRDLQVTLGPAPVSTCRLPRGVPLQCTADDCPELRARCGRLRVGRRPSRMMLRFRRHWSDSAVRPMVWSASIAVARTKRMSRQSTSSRIT
jgi:hypothetical protein